MKECTTHHHACECRESMFDALNATNDTLESENKQLREENKWMIPYAEWGEGEVWREVMKQALKENEYE